MSTFNSLTHGELLLKTWEYSFTKFHVSVTVCMGEAFACGYMYFFV